MAKKISFCHYLFCKYVLDTALETLKSAGSDILQVLVPGIGRRRRFQDILESTRRQEK